MEEKKLLQIALISGIVGIIILFIVSERINLEVSNINSITLKNLNQEVKIRGTITSIKETTKLRKGSIISISADVAITNFPYFIISFKVAVSISNFNFEGFSR